jgi:hypothetical protein
MTIKELAYTAQQHLESITGCSFKRAHIYELLASSFGFKSYAALCSDYVFIQRENDRSIPAQHQSILQKRVVELGYDPMATDVAASAFLTFVSEQHIDVVGVADLVDELSDDDIFLDEFWTSPDSGEYPPILLESLEAKASKGDHLAHYALALLFQADDEDGSQKPGSEYWYSQEQQGRALTGVEKEWADAHARHLEESEKHAFHLREAGRLGNSSALLELAALFHDTSYFDAAIACGITDEPISVAELAESLGREEDAEHWLTVAAKSGDTDAMRRLIDDFERGDVERSWMWFYLAEMIGTDLTKSHLQAFHEGGNHAGEAYDDDVGGPLYVAGDEGAELKPLDEEGKHEARKRADVIFCRIQQPI